MKNFTVKTGFGYLKDDQNKVIAKAILPAGDHPIKDGFTYIEVADQAALDLVTVELPVQTPEQLFEQKIADKLRVMAIERLTADGEL